MSIFNLILGNKSEEEKREGFAVLNGNEFLENFIAWRLLALEGKLGSGKTLFSVALAKWLYDRGMVKGVFSNFPIDESYIPYVPSCINTAVLLDEAWSFADARDSVKGFKGYGAMFRKLGSYLVSPGIYGVDKRMKPVKCERVGDMWVIKTWHYKWADVREQGGSFYFRGYESLFNRYDHRFIPADDGGILETMKDEIRALSGSRRQIYLAGLPEKQLVSPYANPLEVTP